MFILKIDMTLASNHKRVVRLVS